VLIGELADEAGLPLARLRFINAAQAAGLTLSEIRSIIDLRDDGTAPCANVTALIDRKLSDVRARMTHLAALQAELEALLGRSAMLDPVDCGDDDICHILTSPK
jgi:MerR family mercuric resistance operon transcriptional regulator